MSSDKCIKIREFTAYSSGDYEQGVKNARNNETYASSADEIVDRLKSGYQGNFTIIEPDLPSANGLNSLIIEELEKLGYVVELVD